MQKKLHIHLAAWKTFFMGRSFFLMLAILFLIITIVIVIGHAKFLVAELDKSFSRDAGGSGLPLFDIEGFQKLHLIRQQ